MESFGQPVLNALREAIQIADANVAEVDRPDCLIDRQQADVRADQDFAREHARTLPMKEPMRGDQMNFHGGVVFDCLRTR